ncbi:MAG: hypothetical protein AB9891_00615 [Anaerolineaceae bacterium]
MESSHNASIGNSRRRSNRSCLPILLVTAVTLCAVLTAVALSVPLNPVSSVVKTIGYALVGRLHFPQERLGDIVTDKAGHSFTVFREVVVNPAPDQPTKPGAVLILHFQVTNLSPEANKLYSLIPLALYIGDPGFRSKLFTINGADCQSIYTWDTLEDAQNYVNSMALKTILARSVPGSVSIDIFPKE